MGSIYSIMMYIIWNSVNNIHIDQVYVHVNEDSKSFIILHICHGLKLPEVDFVAVAAADAAPSI